MTRAQMVAIGEAATTPGCILKSTAHLRGAAWRAVVSALVSQGYATKCYYPGHVEYVLTDSAIAVTQAPSVIILSDTLDADARMVGLNQPLRVRRIADVHRD